MVKNKVSRPFLKAKWRFMFKQDGSGYFDATGSTLDFMVEKGLVPKDGKFIEWDGKKYYRSQLIQKLEAEGGVSVLRKMLTDSGVECDVDAEAEAEAAAKAAGEETVSAE